MTAHVTPVILCGGSGTRLWPLSRSGFPKQFLSFGGKHSLFQQTALRLHALADINNSIEQTLVVTHEEQRFMALEQLREISGDGGDLAATSSTFLIEPCARNTAAALTLAALQATQNGRDSILVASPSDAFIGNELAYVKALQQAIRHAAGGVIAILGITPTRAETGYGYIHFDHLKAGSVSQVLEFVEKPSAEKALEYLSHGGFAWNSGMFVLKASLWLDALREFRPDILSVCREAWDLRSLDQPAASTVQFVRPDADLFAQVPSESVDYAVMEKCPGSRFPIDMLPLNAAWSDLGAWDAVWQVGAADQQGNVGHGDVMFESSRNTYIHASSRLVSAVGVNDLVIVETEDAVLVSDKSNSQQVKKIVERLASENRQEHKLHRKVHCPWGWYDGIDESASHKVKRIHVKPGASLSLQKHAHRAEHWIVVKGSAEVTRGDQVFTLLENQSTYIEQGQTHRLSNRTSKDLEIIEVQTGSYLGEDDIVRIEDTYGRK